MEHSDIWKLIDALSQSLKKQKLLMCTAESCTGGLIAARCTSLAGSSEWFAGGVVTYTNAMKERVLGVPAAALRSHGAVSLAVVEAMAAGALGLCGAQASVAVSGIAGPSGGSAEKPVGTVCLAVAMERLPGQGRAVQSARFLFKGDRAGVREAATEQGLRMLLEMLE